MYVVVMTRSRDAAPFEVKQLRLYDSQSVPLDEGAQQIHLISAVKLRPNLMA